MAVETKRGEARVALVCGPAGSGKSTHAVRLEQAGYARLSFDEEAWNQGQRRHPVAPQVAEQIHAELRERLVALVGEGRDVVVDTSFWSRASRESYRRLLAPLGVVPVVHYLDVPRAVVLARLAERRGEGPHDVVVGPEQAAAYLDGFEVPTAEEGPLVVLTDDPALRLQDVTFRRGQTQILHSITWEVGRGEHWAMLGPNGAGKSTVLSFCGARTFPSSGTVDVLGQRLGRVELQALRRRIGHVDPRHPLRSPLSVREVVLTGLTGTTEPPMRWRPSPEDLAAADALIESLGLSRLVDAIWPTLSQGERGRALVARALAADPQLLLLDEPSTGLDVAAREQLLETLDLLPVTHPQVATVLVTHHLEELPSTTTHAVLLAHGRVVHAGPVHQVLTSSAISEAFEHPILVGYDEGRWSARGLPRPA